LMKALEKAAKDRGEARNEPPAPAVAAPAAHVAAQSRSELSLEPIATPAPAALTSKPEPVSRPASAPTRVAPAPAAPARDEAQTQASTVLQAQSAGQSTAGGVEAFVRAHPVAVFGTLAGLVAVGFGVYVYVQIFHPAMFVAQPVAKAPVRPPVQTTTPPPVPGTVAPPLSSAPLLKEAAETAPAAAAGATQAKPQPAPPPAAEEAPRNTIAVSSSNAEPVLNPAHTQAYAALQAGQTDEAQRLYSQLVAAEPRNVDALLALAAISAQRGQVDEAVRRYLQILELEPRHALAQAGLIALLGRADPLAAESKLRQLIAREPSAYLHFTLGNLYADQSQWAPAQQAYFQAHNFEPANPDYAYNLAVALEHVSQPKLALGFYRRAAQLAAAKGRSNFSLPQAQERISKLAAQVE